MLDKRKKPLEKSFGNNSFLFVIIILLFWTTNKPKSITNDSTNDKYDIRYTTLTTFVCLFDIRWFFTFILPYFQGPLIYNQWKTVKIQNGKKLFFPILVKILHNIQTHTAIINIIKLSNIDLEILWISREKKI